MHTRSSRIPRTRACLAPSTTTARSTGSSRLAVNQAARTGTGTPAARSGGRARLAKSGYRSRASGSPKSPSESTRGAGSRARRVVGGCGSRTRIPRDARSQRSTSTFLRTNTSMLPTSWTFTRWLSILSKPWASRGRAMPYEMRFPSSGAGRGPNLEQLQQALEEKVVRAELRGRLSPGAMSNPPDRLDGFHTYNLCCRSKQDTGRSLGQPQDLWRRPASLRALVRGRLGGRKPAHESHNQRDMPSLQ